MRTFRRSKDLHHGIEAEVDYVFSNQLAQKEGNTVSTFKLSRVSLLSQRKFIAFFQALQVKMKVHYFSQHFWAAFKTTIYQNNNNVLNNNKVSVFKKL